MRRRRRPGPPCWRAARGPSHVKRSVAQALAKAAPPCPDRLSGRLDPGRCCKQQRRRRPGANFIGTRRLPSFGPLVRSKPVSAHSSVNGRRGCTARDLRSSRPGDVCAHIVDAQATSWPPEGMSRAGLCKPVAMRPGAADLPRRHEIQQAIRLCRVCFVKFSYCWIGPCR